MGIAVRYAPPPSPCLSSWLASHRRRSHLGRAEDICTRGPRGTLPASAVSSTPGWCVRSPGSTAHDAEHATTPRRQTEPERSPSAPGRSRSRPSVPRDWSRRFARSGKVASAVGRDIWLLSIVLLRFPTCAVPGECGVLPTAGSLGSCPESSCEFLRLRSVFPHAAVISAPKYQAKTLRCQAMTVSGRTICRLRRQPGHHRDNKTHNSRSERWNRKRGGAFFWKTASWWRSARISACRAARVRKLEATRAKRATKRELIVIAPGSHE